MAKHKTADTNAEVLETATPPQYDKESQNKIIEKDKNDLDEMREKSTKKGGVEYHAKARGFMLCLKPEGEVVNAIRNNVSLQIPKAYIFQFKMNRYITSKAREIELLDEYISDKKSAGLPCDIMRLSAFNQLPKAPLPEFTELNLGGVVVKAETSRLKEEGYLQGLILKSQDLEIKHGLN